MSTRTPSVHAKHAVSAAILLALLGGCGSSNDDDDEPSVDQTVDAPSGSLAPIDGPGGQEPDTDTNTDSDPDAVVDADLAQTPAPPSGVSLEPVSDKTFRIGWEASAGATSYRVLENPDGMSGFSPITDELDASTRTFDHRVALYKRVNARYVVQACGTDGCADSEELAVSGTLEDAVGYFKADSAGIAFGGAVSLSSDGTTLAVTGESSRVHVFERGDETWNRQAVVNSGNAVSLAVSLSADGDVLAVGAPQENSAATGIDGDQDDVAAELSGAVYVFARTGGDWRQQAYVKADNTGRDDRFGTTVSLSADGGTLAVGAPLEDSAVTGVDGERNDDSAEDSGAVYVFTGRDGSWRQQAYVKASNTSQASELGVAGNFVRAGDEFGTAVSLSADGNTLAVGARFEDSAATGIGGDQADNTAGGSGAVYVFARGDGNWQQQDYLKASNAESTDFFGLTVALSADGDTLAVGAVAEDSAATGADGDQSDNSALDSGAVYLFVRADGGWRQEAYLKASNTDPDDVFGLVVSLSADGNTLAVGTTQEDSSARGMDGDESDNSDYLASSDAAGAVYVFVRDDGSWRQLAYVKASNTDPADVTCELEVAGEIRQFSGDAFGGAVSLSGDGDTLAVGALNECSAATGIGGDQEDNSAFGAGAVYLY